MSLFQFYWPLETESGDFVELHYGTFGNKLCPVCRISSNRLLIQFSVQPIKKALLCKFSKGAVGLDFYLSRSP